MGILLEMAACASFCLLVDCVLSGMKERRRRREKEAESLQKERRRKNYDRLELPRE